LQALLVLLPEPLEYSLPELLVQPQLLEPQEPQGQRLVFVLSFLCPCFLYLAPRSELQKSMDLQLDLLLAILQLEQ
jgi:hypothetical protein